MLKIIYDKKGKIMKEYLFKKPKSRVVLEEKVIRIFKGDKDYMIPKIERGEHVIPYSKIVEIRMNKASLTSKGYLQFTTAQSQLAGALRSRNQPQNSIQFTKKEQEQANDLKNEVEKFLYSE